MKAVIKKEIQNLYRSGRHTAVELASIYGYPVSEVMNAINNRKPGVVTSAIKKVTPAGTDEATRLKWSMAGKKAALTRKKNKLVSQGLMTPEKPLEAITDTKPEKKVIVPQPEKQATVAPVNEIETQFDKVMTELKSLVFLIIKTKQ